MRQQETTVSRILVLLAFLLGLLVCTVKAEAGFTNHSPSIATPVLHDYNYERELVKRSKVDFVVGFYDASKPWASDFVNALEKLFRYYRVFTTANIFRYNIREDDADYEFVKKDPVIASSLFAAGGRFELDTPKILFYTYLPRHATRSATTRPKDVVSVTDLGSMDSIYKELTQIFLEHLPRITPSYFGKRTLHAMQETNDYLHKFNSIATTLFHDMPSSEAEAKEHRANFVRKMEQNADELACTAFGLGYRRLAQLQVRIARLLTGWLPAVRGTSDLFLEQSGAFDAANKVREDAIEDALKIYFLEGRPGRPWTKEETKAQRERLQKLLDDKNNQVLYPGLIKALTDIDVILGAYLEPIPRIVHFIRTDNMPERFGIIQYLAVVSAAKNIKPDVMYFHVIAPGSGYWWDRAKKYFTVRFVPPPTHIGAKQLSLAAHQSDVIRIDVLDEMGGIYLDWDVITWRSFDPLLKSGAPTIFGRERKVPKYDEVVGVAVILSRPRAPFIRLWREKMADAFDYPRCYACHSVALVRSLALQKPSWVRILEPTAFNSPGWERPAVERMFLPQNFDPTIVDRIYPPANDSVVGPDLDEDGSYGNLPHGGVMPFPIGYAMHLFESNEHFQAVTNSITEENIKNVNTNFNVLVRRYFD